MKEIKEILDYFRKYMTIDDCIRLSKIEDYITNLQTIEKEHQKLNGELREEINFLKLNNPDANIEHFRVVRENKRKINNLRAENKRLKQNKKETLECLKEFHNYENRFKWCEEDYIDTINMFEKKLQGEDNE